MSCQVEQIADCGDISSLARALFVFERDGEYKELYCYALFFLDPGTIKSLMVYSRCELAIPVLRISVVMR